MAQSAPLLPHTPHKHEVPFDRFIGAPRLIDPVRIDIDAGIILLLFPLVLLLLFGSLLREGSILATHFGDAACEWWWKRQYVGESLANFRLPQWNPFAMSGAPLLATSQPAPFYPPNWAFAVLSPVLAFNGNILFHFWLGLAGTYLLVRHLRRSPEAAVTASMVFGLGGVSVQHWFAGHLQFNAEIAMMPWAVLAWCHLQRATDNLRLVASALGVTFILSMQLLSGHPQIVYYTLGVLALLQVGWVCWNYASFGKESTSSMFRSSAWLVLSLVLVGLMTAIQVLPMREFAHLTVRAQSEGLKYFSMHSQLPSNLLTFIAPFVFGGKPGGPNFLVDSRSSYWEGTTFIGAGCVMVVLLAVLRVHRLPAFAWICLFGAVVCELLSIGEYGPFFSKAYKYFPGMNLFRCPGRMLIPFSLFVALLAGIGLDELRRLRSKYPRQLMWLLVGVGVVVITISADYFARFRSAQAPAIFTELVNQRRGTRAGTATASLDVNLRLTQFRGAVEAALLLTTAVLLICVLFLWQKTRRAGSILLCVLVSAEILWYAASFRVATRPSNFTWPAELTARLKSAGPMYRIQTHRSSADVCQAMTNDLRHVWGYETAVVQQYNKAICTSLKVPEEMALFNMPVNKLSPFMNTLGVRYLASDRQVGRQSGWLQLGRYGELILFENRNAHPRASVVESGIKVTAAQSRDLVCVADFDSRKLVLLEGAGLAVDARAAITTATLPASATGVVKTVRDEAEHFAALIQMRREGWFVLMDQLLPGWTATVNGKPVELVRANAIGRAVKLPPGGHLVEMRYRTPGLVTGAVLSGIGWVVWLAGAAYIARAYMKKEGRFSALRHFRLPAID